MRLLLISVLALAGFVSAAEPASSTGSSPDAYPLWDGQESTADYARRVNLPPGKTIDVGGGVRLELLLIPAGTFTMGTPEPEAPKESAFSSVAIVASSGALVIALLAVVATVSIRQRRRPTFSLGMLTAFVLATGALAFGIMRWQRVSGMWSEFDAARMRYEAACDQEKPARTVKLTSPFYMSKFEVTQAQYQAVTSRNPSAFEGRDHPVDSVSMNDALKFCEKLKLRLPSEAEWEYACRAGSQTAFYSGDSESELKRVAWHESDCGNSTHPVGQKIPNRFGLFDMHGNVSEWCREAYAEYSSSFANDPRPAVRQNIAVLKGGGWTSSALTCRSSQRSCARPDLAESWVGFRVVMDVAK